MENAERTKQMSNAELTSRWRPPQEISQFYYRVPNYDGAPLDCVRQTSPKNDFVYRETNRLVDGPHGVVISRQYSEM